MRLPSLRAVAGLAGTFAFLSCADAPTAPELATRALSPQAKAVTYPAVLISQIYGGGGNSGATLRNDFIELFNPGSSPVNLTGWRVGYASSAGSSWQYTALSGTIPAGGYYLVQQAQGSGGTVALPTPDAVGTIAMAAGAGKVIVQNAAVALSGTCPIGGSVVDQVGFGTASNCGAVWGATTATLNNTTAALRQDDGCRYTPPLAAATDFATGAPAPRNTATATIVCEGGEDPGPQPASVTVDPASAALTVGGTVTLSASALDADGAPIATSFTWSSSASAVASVSAAGVVTANAAGTATITATTPNGVSAGASITVTAPPRAQSDATIQINELMGDPVNAESASWGEWFEVHNTGSVAVDLNGWTILSGGSGQPAHVIDESVVVPAGGYAVLGRGNDPARNGGLALDYNYFVGTSSTIWLDNNDYLVLLDGASALVDSLSWTSLPRGATKGLRPGAAPVTNADDAAWGFSISTFGDGDYGTPDAVNEPLGDTPPAVSPNRLSISGRLSSDTLPVGFEDQLFATLRDPSNTVIPTTITWTSLTPALASVDARGVIRALAVGNAVFRAVAEDGTGRNITIPLKIALPSAVTYADHAEFGEPVDADASDDFLVRRREYTTSWNGGRGIPNWVVYNLTGDHIVSGQDRCDCFTFDPELETAGFARYTTADYTGAGAFLGAGIGVDRGHLARSFDRTAGALDNANTFLFSNIIPQFSDNNQGPWAQHENYLGNLATAENKELFIYAGASGSLGTVKNEGLITIPAWTWKVSVIAPRGTRLEDVRDYRDLEVIAVVMPNAMGIRNANWQSEYVVTADSVERLSGYRFLSALPEKTRRALVTGTKPPLGDITEPVAGLEGAPIAFNASNSVDPNGSIVSYAWDFGDGNTGTGVATSHTYEAFGSYTARLVVVDNDGLADTTYTTVEVAQVTPAQGIAQVRELVHELATLIGLNRGETQALLAKVNAAEAALERGNVEAALGQLGALRNQLDALVNSGRATSEGIERIALAIERVERAAN